MLMREVMSMQKVKAKGHRSQNPTYDDEMMPEA